MNQKFFLRFSFLLVFLVNGCSSGAGAKFGAGASPIATSEVPKRSANAHAAYQVIQRDGMTLVELATKDEADKELLSLTVAPEAGTNVISIRHRGVEILEQAKTLSDVSKQDAGIEFLYPTPNRVRDGRLEYKDLKLSFKPNLGKNFIHGLARDYAWRWNEPKLEGKKVVYETWLNVDEKSDFYTRFPIKNRFGMTITLEGETVHFEFNVANVDQRPLPFGLGVHPYFKLNGTRSQSTVVVPVLSQMDAVDLLPTGKLIPLKKTKYAKLPKGMTVQDVMGADTVFWPTQTEKVSIVREPGLQFEIATSKDFGHSVLWAPPTRELFAIENQTSSTDAHNLANKGFVKESGLIEIAPGSKWSGWVSYRFSKR